MIAELKEYFPKWKNTLQMVMCLHVCGYNVGETMRFVEDNNCGDDEGASVEEKQELVALRSEIKSLRAQLDNSVESEVLLSSSFPLFLSFSLQTS